MTRDFVYSPSKMSSLSLEMFTFVFFFCHLHHLSFHHHNDREEEAFDSLWLSNRAGYVDHVVFMTIVIDIPSLYSDSRVHL